MRAADPALVFALRHYLSEHAKRLRWICAGRSARWSGVSGSGVFWARTVDELDEAIGERRRRAISSLAGLSELKRIKAAMLGQTTIPEVAP